MYLFTLVMDSKRSIERLVKGTDRWKDHTIKKLSNTRDKLMRSICTISKNDVSDKISMVKGIK